MMNNMERQAASVLTLPEERKSGNCAETATAG